MSRSKVGRRITWPRPRNKHLNGEIWGRSDFIVGPNSKVYPRAGGEPVGSPSSKKWAKTQAARIHRRRGRNIVRQEVE